MIRLGIYHLGLAGWAAAAPFAAVWQLGADDSQSLPFSQENFSPNNPPGSALLLDDDYYHPTEPLANFERALTSADPRKRIHFPLTAAQASATSRLRITVDLFAGGAWVNGPIPGFSRHDVHVKFNGQTLGTHSAIAWDRTLTYLVSAASVAAVAGENVLHLERTGGPAGGYISLDFIKLEADGNGLSDADGDGMPLWFEETYGAADPMADPDTDGRGNLAEFLAGTNPTDRDSDNDGLTDLQEITTNPLVADSDGDGLPDGAETSTNPLLADSDGDGHPDNIELEQASNPTNATSVPFDFPGAISLQFICERLATAALPAGEPAGYFRLPHWNASAPLPHWVADGTLLSGSRTALKNHRGQPTTAAASWSYHFAGEGLHKGPGDERLLNGMIRTQRTGTINSNNTFTTTINTPVSLSITGIPFASYDLIIYVGNTYPGSRAVVSRQGDASSARYLSSASEPPFLGFREVISETTPQAGNYVRYRNLGGPGQTVSLTSLQPLPPPPENGGALSTVNYSTSAAIHGIQIIDSATDTDGDGMKDALEIENRFNPAIPDATADADADNLTNAAELAAATDPQHPDSDRDGIPDGAEAALGCSPLDADTDNDTLTDGDEIHALPFPSLPTDIDSDDDGFTDLTERTYFSNPLSNASTPPPVPVWNAATRTWLWRIDHVRVLWNHERSMLGAIEFDESMLFEAVADIEQSGWARQIGIGLRYQRGKLMHRFRGIEGAFHRSGSASQGFWDSDWSATPVDRTRAYGFSGHGPADESWPLRLEFSATQPDAGQNRWTLQFLIRDLANNVTLASFTDHTAVAADPSLLNGTSVWKNTGGVAGRIDWWNETGVRTLISTAPLGTPDIDDDGMPDGWETANLFNPTNAADATLDPDADGLTNVREFLAGTNPRDADSDDDGASDGVELHRGFDPLSATSIPTGFNFTGRIDDLDNDGLSDAWLLWSGGTPRVPAADDDGDGMSNLAESQAGTDPADPRSRLDLTGRRSGDDFVLSWTDLPDKTSRVETSDSLAAWQTATGLPAPSVGGGRRQITIPSVFPAAMGRFYRTGVRAMDSDADGVEDWVENRVLGSSALESGSLGQSLVKSNGQLLSGDAVALLERLQGTPQANGAPSPVNAARFLMQASFGPTPAAIQEVKDLGFAAWIDRQSTLTPSLLQPYIREIKADGAGPRIDPTYNWNELDRFVHGNNITTPFARNAIGGEDQLRQRVAFALSQILVVSRRDANLEEKTEAMTNYYDTLARHALGNYGDLLREVTFHPTMGWYLSHAGNQKADPSIPRYPDENYAREYLQLFTIGLWELNPDGSRKLDGNGEPIPTYDNGDITELARVFTGLYFASPYGWAGGGWADEHFTRPMVMYAERHDFEAKRLPRGVVIPAREATEANALQDVRDAVDSIFHHPNTPPFVCRQLIQFLVTDNPTPGYIRRAQDVFVDDGAGVRGNLAAVVKAILLDPEARNPPLSPAYGKVREPVIRTMHLGRLLRLAEAHPKFTWWNWTENYYGFSIQEPLNSPSVFNFYTPVYQSPGEIRNAGLVSPGFQIVNTYSAVSFPNLLWDYLHDGFKSGYALNYPMDSSDTLLLAENPAALVDHVDLLVCAGSMTARTRGILLGALAGLTPKDRVALAIWTAMTCPEGVVQK